MALKPFPCVAKRFCVASLAIMTSVTIVRGAEADTIWTEVYDTTVVKKQRPVVKMEQRSIAEPIFFKIRESNSREALGVDEAIRKVSQLMQTSPDAHFTVTGYADRGTGNPTLNKMYAQRRSDDVVRKLTEEYGVDPRRLKSDSKGDVEQPFADNDKNRCVIITGEGTFRVTAYEDYDSLVISRRKQIVRIERDTLIREPRRELLSIKTNVLLDMAYVPFGYDRWCPIPNVALEYYPKGGHFTFGGSIDFPWWQHYWQHKYFQMRNYQLEARYYMHSGDASSRSLDGGMAFKGLYAQAYAHAGVYCFCFNADKGWIGEAVGAGLGIGYVMPLSKKGRWRLELGAQFGFIFSGYDPFQYEYRGSASPNDHLYYYDWTLPSAQFKKRQYRYTWFGPTRVGITFSYDLLYRRKAKKGVSMNHYEQTERRVTR